MVEGMIIFSLAAAGSSLALTRDHLIEFLSRKVLRQSLATAGVQRSGDVPPWTEPLPGMCLTVGFYGLAAATLVLCLPGEHALERTLLAFALMCVGGLIAELTRPRTGPAADTSPGAFGPALVLMLLLNAAFALVGSGQGLVGIVPPGGALAHLQSPQLDPIVVVGRRVPDPLESASSFL